MSDVQVVPIKDSDLKVSDDSAAANVQDGVVSNNGMTQINVNPDDKTDKNGEAMAKKAADGTDVHKLIAGKYKTQEDFDKAILAAFHKKHGDNAAKAYNELAGDLSNDSTDDSDGGANAASDDSQNANTDVDDDEGSTDDDDSGNANPAANLDPHMDQFVEEFSKDGKLSDDSYEKLQEVGYDRSMVDTFLKGVQATQNELYDKVGGKENYAEMQTWASQNLTNAEIDLFNADMNSGDMAKMERAVDLLAAKFVKVNGGFAPKKRVSPEGGEINSSVTGYKSLDEMKKDMKNPLYQTDRTFRAKVREKIKNGNV